MSPPIYTPDGSEVSEIVLPDGSTASQVIGPDGNVVFEAGGDIPDAQDLHVRYDWSDEDGTAPVNDQTGNGHDLDMGSYSGVDGSINGVQAGVLDAGNGDYLEAEFPDIPQPYSIFVVYQLTSNGRAAIYDSTDQFSTLQERSSQKRLFVESALDLSVSQNKDPYLHTAIFDGANTLSRLDGGSFKTTGDAGSNDLSGIRVGRQNSGASNDNYASMHIGEILVYPQDKSSIIPAVEDYLTQKWGPF